MGIPFPHVSADVYPGLRTEDGSQDFIIHCPYTGARVEKMRGEFSLCQQLFNSWVISSSLASCSNHRHTHTEKKEITREVYTNVPFPRNLLHDSIVRLDVWITTLICVFSANLNLNVWGSLRSTYALISHNIRTESIYIAPHQYKAISGLFTCRAGVDHAPLTSTRPTEAHYQLC